MLSRILVSGSDPSVSLLRALLVVAALFLFASPPSVASAQPRDERIADLSLDVMTFNIRTSAIPDGDDAWPLRKGRVIETIGRLDPDVIGLQEALAEQIEFIAAQLPQYRWLGADRGLNGGTGLSEATPIFYRHAEMVPLESGTFWLGDMPNGSYRGREGGRGGSRIVTWARFHHLETGREVWVYNTHLSPRAGRQHVTAAEAINDRIAALPPATPVVVLGDFNATAGSSETWLAATSRGLRDAWDVASAREGPPATYNGFRSPGSEEEGEGRIDWVLIGGPVDVSAAVTVVHSPQGHYPSDHFPVLARLTIGPS
jgi:endonuclease/exonuclease/phosphatase family metal-dependent hydrolase